MVSLSDLSVGTSFASVLLSVGTVTGFSAIHFLIGFLLLICVIAIVIIGVKWLITLTGVAIPQPLLLIAGIILFIVLLLVLLQYSGLYSF
jgi:hypothetical protein